MADDVHLDDPITAQLMEAINEARILLASHDHRQDLAEIAKISNDLIRLEERRAELQTSIGKRQAVYIAAEEALHGHLATKHGLTTPQPQTPVSDDPEPIVRVRPKPDAHHASNCAVYFGDPCDCA